MTLQVPPVGTALSSTTYPHRKYHGALTEIQYVHPSGSNSNDGYTWGSAKADVVSAYDALPSGGGTIYIADLSYWDSVNTDRGLWLLGANDPGYNGGSPTGGWRVRKKCAFIGVNGPSNASNNHAGGMVLIQGGSQTDRSKPAIWIAGSPGPLLFKNILTQYHAVAWRMGVKSNLSGNIDSSGITFENCGFNMNQIVGNGPGMELGYMYWLFMRDCVFNGNAASYTLTAATRVATTATFTTSVAHVLAVGDTVYVSGVTPSGYNGTWTVATVPTTTTFTATLTADPGGSGTVFGTAEPVKNYYRAAIAHYSDFFAANETPSGLLHFENCNFNSGGFYYKPNGATSWGSIVMRDITHEGDFAGPEPPTLLIRTNTYGSSAVAASGSDIFVQNMSIADASSTTAVEIEGLRTSPSLVTVVNSSVTGNATVMSTTNDRRQGGFSEGEILGGHAGHKRAFGPAAVRYVNLSSHTLSGGSWTTGVTAPDGTTGASSLTGSGATATADAYSGAQNFSVGDWIILGVWRRRSTVGTDDNANFPLVDFSDNSLRWDNSSSDSFTMTGPNNWGHGYNTDDTGWTWLYEAHKVTTAANGTLTWVLRAADGNTIAYYAPILIKIPVGDSVSEYEIYEMLRHLQTYPTTAAAGDVATLANQNFHVTGPLEIDGALNHDGTTVGFYGVTPIARATLATGAGHTVDDVITALQNLGLVKQS